MLELLTVVSYICKQCRSVTDKPLPFTIPQIQHLLQLLLQLWMVCGAIQLSLAQRLTYQLCIVTHGGEPRVFSHVIDLYMSLGGLLAPFVSIGIRSYLSP